MLREINRDNDQTSRQSTPDTEQVKRQILQLSQQISDLTKGYNVPIDDLGLAQSMAESIKPYVDRLVTLNKLLNPVGRIVSKRDQIEVLQSDIAEDVAAVENLAEYLGQEIDTTLIDDLQSELSSVKKDRKLFVSKVDVVDAPKPNNKPKNKKKSPSLIELPLEQRFERIFGNRFVTPARLESLIGVHFDADFSTITDAGLKQVWHWIYNREDLRPHIDNNRIKTLKNTFADYALLLRSPYIGDKTGESVKCTLATLRERFDTFFVSGPESGLWYTNMPFYHQPISKGHWTLVDRQYLNCTFKKPSIRLLMYAKANGLGNEMVRQKSVTEDLYDRILLELAMQERFVDHCHSITGTAYQPNVKTPIKQVYTYYKEDAIRISGKSGIPHWRPSKPRWPGVLPSIIFS